MVAPPKIMIRESEGAVVAAVRYKVRFAHLGHHKQSIGYSRSGYICVGECIQLHRLTSHSCIGGTNIRCLGVFLSSLLDPEDIALNRIGKYPCSHGTYTAVEYMLLNIIIKSSSHWLNVS